MIDKNKAILGVFEGECADANITNLNGLDITREVWENVFDSEEYKKGIELGHYIGFLGHPEDPACQDFEKACIVMTEGSIDSDGKVYGKFNLVDTPVGRIVKSFQDAGVIFGISVRGAGDIVNNSVDPDTFVFRGFDLVAFPAYPESIPEFIAASSDVDKQKKYKAVCASIDENVKSINDVETINILQSHLAKQSEGYAKLENRKNELIEECEDDLSYEQVRGMYNLYMNEKDKNSVLSNKIISLNRKLNAITSDNKRRIKSIERIMASQLKDMNDIIIKEQNKSKQSRKIMASQQHNYRMMEDDFYKIEDDYRTIQENYDILLDKYNKLEAKYKSCKSSLKDINDSNSELSDTIESLENEVKECKNSNLIYKKEIESANNNSDEKDRIIASLEKQLSDTVTKLKDSEDNKSNRDKKFDVLQSELDEANDLIQEYQDAYANLYANALGVYLPKVNITSNASVKDIQDIILGTSDINREGRKVAPTDLSAESFDKFDDDGLVTI